jgi:hypothetical protein
VTDRVEIRYASPLPERDKYIIVGEVQNAVNTIIAELNEKHGLSLIGTVKPIRESALTGSTREKKSGASTPRAVRAAE